MQIQVNDIRSENDITYAAIHATATVLGSQVIIKLVDPARSDTRAYTTPTDVREAWATAVDRMGYGDDAAALDLIEPLLVAAADNDIILPANVDSVTLAEAAAIVQTVAEFVNIPLKVGRDVVGWIIWQTSNGQVVVTRGTGRTLSAAITHAFTPGRRVRIAA